MLGLPSLKSLGKAAFGFTDTARHHLREQVQETLSNVCESGVFLSGIIANPLVIAKSDDERHMLRCSRYLIPAKETSHPNNEKYIYCCVGRHSWRYSMKPVMYGCLTKVMKIFSTMRLSNTFLFWHPKIMDRN